MTQRPRTQGEARPSEVRPEVLVVDDERDNIELMVRSLRGDFEVLTAGSGKEALDILAEHDVSVIVTDQRMPEMSGVEFLRQAAEVQPGAKRLMLTAYADSDSLIQAINEGRVHYYIRKPWDRHQLQSTVAELVHLRRLEEENRQMVEKLSHVNQELADRERLLSKSLDERGQELLAANTSLRNANLQLEKMAFRDGLTGLYNHRSFQERLREEVARVHRYSRPCSLLFMDLDHFKKYNDRHGHPAGDEILQTMGKLLLGQLDPELPSRDSDVAARYGGEEFVLLLPETLRAGAEVKAERIRQAVERTSFRGRPGAMTVSIGVAECPTDGGTADELLLCADQALYQAKERGRNRVEVYGAWIRAQGHNRRPQATLPAFLQCVDSAQQILEKHGHLMVLYIDLSELGRIEQEYGHATYSDVLARLAPMIARVSPELIREGDVLATGYQEQASFVVLLSRPLEGEHGPAAPEAIAAFCERLARGVQRIVDAETAQWLRIPARVTVGSAMGLVGRRSAVARQIAMLVREASTGARANRERSLAEEKLGFQSLLLSQRLRSVYQPIVDAHSERPVGYESLVRGPEGGELESATALLQAAMRAELQWEFDNACLRTALAGAQGLAPDAMLFLNVMPPTFFDRVFLCEELPALVGGSGLRAEQVVLEVTEQLAVSNLERLRDAVDAARARGFRIALDDVGAAQTNLQQLQALAPDFIKLDLSIVQGIARAPARREFVRSLVKLGEGLGARCVAEGVETREDLSAVRDAGVQLVQGYFFARPGRLPPRP